MKLSPVLFDRPATAQNVANTMHESPRESKAWFGWLFLGMMAGGSIMGVWDIYQERVRIDERVSASYRGAAESQSWPHPAGHLSQPTAGAR